MLRMLSTHLQAGMVTALPIANPQRAEMNLLNAEVALEQHAIQRLQSLGVCYVWVRHPGLEFLDERIGPEVPAQRQKIYRQIKGTFGKLSESTAATNISFHEYRTAVTELVSALVANPNHAMMLEQLSAGSDGVVEHGASVAYLAVMLGIQMESYLVRQRARLSVHHAREVVNLGIGAMLHDIGKLRQPEQAAQMTVLDEAAAEDPIYREHCQLGYELVRGRTEASASQVVLNHHQRHDGTGFPPAKDARGELMAPPAANKIHIFSRIVGLIDAFDHLRVGADGTEWPPIRALYELQTHPFAGWFDPVLFRGLYEMIPPFTIGSLVTLSNNCQAVVCSFDPSKPCTPEVTLFADPGGKLLEGPACEKIDLNQKTDLRITHADGIGISDFYYEMPACPVEQTV